MKKIILILLIFVFISSLASCKSNDEPVVDGNDPVVDGNENNESNENEKSPYSEGIEYASLGEGKCAIRSIGSCKDVDIIIPPTSPSGDIVTLVDSNAFSGAESILSITLPASVIKIENSAFKNCTALKGVIFAEDSELSYIGQEAFRGCTSMSFMALPEGVESLGEKAFATCTSLAVLRIPSTLTSIGKEAFHGCQSLAQINVTEGNTQYKGIDGNLYSADGKTLIMYAMGKTDRSFEIPDGVATIGEKAFAYVSRLDEVIFPESLTTISDHAFMMCTSLSGVVIPNGVRTIGKSAFYSCTDLTTVEISRSVTSIGILAFSNCTSLTEIKVAAGNTSFKDIDGNLYNYAGSKLIQYAIGKTDKSLEIPASVTTIGSFAFRDCKYIEKVTLAASSRLTTIESGAFFACESLTDVEIASSVKSISINAFNSSNALKTFLMILFCCSINTLNVSLSIFSYLSG